ncbi:MAG: UDP-N-acetylmuramate--L-alanine ligase [Selenomonadaceae bacterium]|nr:UDP-N-acetylmuramate--L-alanine ligase [Selenomonadaceae bacterium]
MILEGIKKIHFVGIGGAGMSPLARILLDLGYKVSGSDRADSPTVRMLRGRGAEISIGHAEENINNDLDAVVISSAIPDDNPEIAAAKKLRMKILHRSDINAALLNDKKGIAVAGAHGKTTTTSMIGFVLYNAGVDPTIIIGGESADLGTSAILGKSDYLVSEADESDGSFVKLHPAIAVVTNVEDDHLDHYGTIDNIKKAFKTFIENIDRENGVAVLCFDNENLRELSEKIDRKIISYAIENDADYIAKNIDKTSEGIDFDVFYQSKLLGRVNLKIHGQHNVLNALATIAVAQHVGVDFEDIAKGLSQFHGAKRRFQTKGHVKNVWIVDDYAHHPTEIAATLKAARDTKPRRLICVFQPHRYSRTKLLLKEFGTAFKDADVLVLTDIYAAGEKPIEGVNGESLLKEVLETTSQDVSYIPKVEEIANYLVDIVEEGDLVITMGAGNIYRVGEELVEMLKHRKKIIVVMGGTSTEAEVSRRTGKAILNALLSKGYDAEGMELNPQTFAGEIRDSECDIVFNALHGKYGEDGLVQGTLDMLDIPYTGSGVLSAALTMDKVMAKRIFNAKNINTPKFVVYRRTAKERGKAIADNIEKMFGFPVVIKAPNQGSSIGVYIVEKKSDLADAARAAFEFGEEIIVEEFIKGREMTVAVWGNAEHAEAFPIIEITTLSGRYDYESKYTKGASTHICPAEISEELTKEIQELAVKTFEVCKCCGVARIDMMLSEDNIPYVIEVNSVPGMTETSLVPDAAAAIGIEFPELCERILRLANF